MTHPSSLVPIAPTWLRAIIAALLALLAMSVTRVALADEVPEPGEQGAAEHGNTANKIDEHAHTPTAGTEHGAPHADAPHGTSAAHGESDDGEDGHDRTINWTDIFNKKRPAFVALLINFGILVGAFYALGKKPIAESLKQRRVAIGQDIEDARKMLDEAKERAKKYQADLKNADADAATAKTTLVTAAKGEVEHMIADAEERGERMKRDAERLVEQEKKQVAQDLQIETVNLAVTHAQKILEKSVNAEDHTRLANELLAELQRKPSAARSIAPMAPRVGGAS